MPMMTVSSASPPCAVKASSRPVTRAIVPSLRPKLVAATQEELLAAAGFSGKTLENWLRDGFFDQHCKLFHQRPFIWHVWDGRRGGFSALINYHKLDRRQLEKLTYTYLRDWIKRREAAW